jgi:hypothetical protein
MKFINKFCVIDLYLHELNEEVICVIFLNVSTL